MDHQSCMFCPIKILSSSNSVIWALQVSIYPRYKILISFDSGLQFILELRFSIFFISCIGALP